MTDPAPVVQRPDMTTIRAYINRLPELLPPTIANGLADELWEWMDYGWKLGGNKRINGIINDLADLERQRQRRAAA